jgi:hypothetical protein
MVVPLKAVKVLFEWQLSQAVVAVGMCTGVSTADLGVKLLAKTGGVAEGAPWQVMQPLLMPVCKTALAAKVV